MWRLDLPYPTICFYWGEDKTGWKRVAGGWTECETHTVWYNETVAALNGPDFNHIIIHEVAHLVAYALFPAAKDHGREFFVIDLALGGGGFVYHDLQTLD